MTITFNCLSNPAHCRQFDLTLIAANNFFLYQSIAGLLLTCVDIQLDKKIVEWHAKLSQILCMKHHAPVLSSRGSRGCDQCSFISMFCPLGHS